MNSERLKDFRQAAYELLVRAKDATRELMDSVMTTRNVSCLAEFRSIHYSIVTGLASTKRYKTVDLTEKN
jgi:hypothetical protein